MRRLLFALALGTAIAGGTFPGQASNLDRTTNGQYVSVTVSSPFSDLPPGGCVPYRVTIRNDQSTTGTWHLLFQGEANTSSLGATVFEQDMTVAPNATGSFDLLVPLPIVSPNRGSSNLNIGVTGPGFDNTSVYKQFFAYVYTNYSNPRSSFTIIGKGVLGAIGLSPLQTFYKDKGMEFYGSDVDAANLPSDWRAYSGVAGFFLADTEWLGLNATQREAVSDYVAQGGHLTLFTSDNPETRIPGLQLPEPDGRPGPYGFGTISLLSTASFPPDPSTLKTALESNPARSAENIDQAFVSWSLRQMVGTIAVSGAFIISFVLLFGSLVGPVNLFVFARGNQRMRLFWTTPLISLFASLALVAGILVTDGLGGSGKQMIAIFSLPGATREAVIQEQIAHTAVLFSTQWRNDQNYLVTPISAESISGAMAPQSFGIYSHRTSRGNLADSPGTYHQQGNLFSGNWFRSRAVSGQYLQAVRPSRSVLTVLNPAGADAVQDPPVVLSSFPDDLTKVYLIDLQGNYWMCEHLEPGRKQTCVAVSANDFNGFWNEACANAGGKLRPLLSIAANRRGCFYATGTPSSSESLATLGEIRWQVTSGVYLGPWVPSPTPEKGP